MGEVKKFPIKYGEVVAGEPLGTDERGFMFGGRGYRTWRLGIENESPRLLSPAHGSGYVWKPGENVSDMPADPNIAKQKFQMGGGPGFYAMKKPEDLIETGYYPGTGDLPGEIAPYGIVCEDEKGLRAQKAQITQLMSGGEICDICHREQASNILTYYQSNKSTPAVFACPTCTKRIAKVAPKHKRLEGISVDELLDKLAQHYNVDVMPLPEAFRTARKTRRY